MSRRRRAYFFLFSLFISSNGLQPAITDCLVHSPMYQQYELVFSNLYLVLLTAQHQRIHWFQPHCDILYARIKEKNNSYYFSCRLFQRLLAKIPFSELVFSTPPCYMQQFPYQRVAVLNKTSLLLQTYLARIYGLEMA